MEEPGAEAERGGDAGRATHRLADLLERRRHRRALLQEGVERQVVSLAEPAQVGPDPAGRRRVARGAREDAGVLRVGEEAEAIAEQRGRLGRKGPGLLDRRRHLARRHLGGLHVGLVEGVHSQDGAGDGGGDLPAEELLADVGGVGDVDADHRRPGPLQRRDGPVLLRRRRKGQPDVHEESILPDAARRSDRLAHHRHDPLPLLPEGLGHQLLDPVGQPGDPRRRDQGELVPAVAGGRAQHDAQHEPRVLVAGPVGGTGVGHDERPVEQPRHAHAHGRGRNHPEVGERGEAAAHVGNTLVDLAESLALGLPLELGPRVGDGDEAARCLASQEASGPVEEVGEERRRLDRRPRLGRHDEERPAQVDLPLEGPDLRGHGGVEDAEDRVTRDAAEGAGEDVGAEARTPHSQDDRVAEAGQPHVLRDPSKLLAAGALLLDEPQPPYPAVLVPSRPEGRVASPETGHLLPGHPLGGRAFHLPGQRRGEREPLRPDRGSLEPRLRWQFGNAGRPAGKRRGRRHLGLRLRRPLRGSDGAPRRGGLRRPALGSLPRRRLALLRLRLARRGHLPPSSARPA